jgi:hypothetical protein
VDELGDRGSAEALDDAQAEELPFCLGKSLQVAQGLRGAGARRKPLVGYSESGKAACLVWQFIERDRTCAASSKLAQSMPQKIPRDSVYPGHEGLAGIESVQARPSGDEDFLMQVFALFAWKRGAQECLHRRGTLLVDEPKGVSVSLL